MKRARENEENDARKRRRAREHHRMSEKTIKTEPAGSRETGEEGPAAIWE